MDESNPLINDINWWKIHHIRIGVKKKQRLCRHQRISKYSMLIDSIRGEFVTSIERWSAPSIVSRQFLRDFFLHLCFSLYTCNIFKLIILYWEKKYLQDILTHTIPCFASHDISILSQPRHKSSWSHTFIVLLYNFYTFYGNTLTTWPTLREQDESL